VIELTRQDLLPFAPSITEEQAQPLIAGTLARAAIKAPCILDDAFAYQDAAKDILMAAVLRRFMATGGAVTKAAVGSVSIEYAGATDGGLSSGDILELQEMCRQQAGTIASAPACDYSFPVASDWPDPVERAVVVWW
jgi:hypothetical protein